MIGRRAMWPLLAALTMVPACTDSAAVGAQKELELGPHRVQVSTPAGWELLDQGARKRFRKGESEIVLENLGADFAQLADWGLAALASLGNDRRREVKSRRATIIDNHEAMEIETWNRLDHTWPQFFLFVRVEDDLLALHTPRLADAPTAKAFESIRDSIHFGPSVRR